MVCMCVICVWFVCVGQFHGGPPWSQSPRPPLVPGPRTAPGRAFGQTAFGQNRIWPEFDRVWPRIGVLSALAMGVCFKIFGVFKIVCVSVVLCCVVLCCVVLCCVWWCLCCVVWWVSSRRFLGLSPNSVGPPPPHRPSTFTWTALPLSLSHRKFYSFFTLWGGLLVEFWWCF